MSENWKIVLIDDEEDIRDVMSIALADAGYAVRAAADGEAGLRMDRNPPADRHHRHPHARHGRPPGAGASQAAVPRHRGHRGDGLRRDAAGDPCAAAGCLGLHPQADGSDNLFLALERARERYTSRRRLKDYTQLLEKEKAETSQQLLKTLAFQRNLIENSMDGILGVDERQVVVIYNRSMEQLLGFPRDQVLHRKSCPVSSLRPRPGAFKKSFAVNVSAAGTNYSSSKPC